MSYLSFERLEEKRSKSASPLCCSCDYRNHCNTRAPNFNRGWFDRVFLNCGWLDRGASPTQYECNFEKETVQSLKGI